MARKPKAKKPPKEQTAKLERRGPGALAIVVLLLFWGGASFATWLAYTYEPVRSKGQQADAVFVIVPIDLAKKGSNQQMAPSSTAISDDGQDAKIMAKPGGKTLYDRSAFSRSNKTPKPQKNPQNANEITKKAALPNAAHTPKISGKPKHQNYNPKRSIRSAPAPYAATQQASIPLKPRGSFTRLGGLWPAPDPALIKRTDSGPLPIIAPDGRTPLQVYARPYNEIGQQRIAIVVGSLGMSEATTLAAIQQLPGGVTLSFAPYGRNLQDYVNLARAAGHEVLLQVPMEPVDYTSDHPGPHTLLTSLTIKRNLKRLDWLLGRFTGYVGVVNYMGGRFTSAEFHLLPVLETMQARGLMFLDSKASPSSVAYDVANRVGLYFASNDRVIDEVASRSAIDSRLLELEQLALDSGSAIGIGFPYPVTIERLAQWAYTIDDRGFDLVPVSALTDHRTPSQ